MKIDWKKARTGFAAAYVVSTSCVLGAFVGKSLVERHQSPAHAFVLHCQQDRGVLSLEASAAGHTLYVTPVCRFRPAPDANPKPPRPPAAQSSAQLQI